MGITSKRCGEGRGASEHFASAPSPGMHWRGGGVPPMCNIPSGYPPRPPSRAPSLCPATVSLTPSASLNGICNRH